MIRLAFFPLVVLLALVIVFALASDDAGPQDPAFRLTEDTANSAFTVTAVQSRYQGRTAEWWARRAVQARKDANARARVIRRLRAQLVRDTQVTPTLAIRLVFGGHAHEALRVAWCESRWDTGATNGQFLGLFQMGGYARSRYGHSSDPLTQARAAYAYFVDSGRDWSPWDVPAVSIDAIHEGLLAVLKTFQALVAEDTDEAFRRSAYHDQYAARLGDLGDRVRALADLLDEAEAG